MITLEEKSLRLIAMSGSRCVSHWR